MRYIDADALIKKIYPMGIGDGKYTINAKAVKLAIDNTPSADVVPKSEVEKIFEEIERFLYMHFRFCKEEIGNDDAKYFEGRLELNTQIQNFIAELKKKYT
jgi:hypothetical protein